ncbi:MAG: Cyclin-T2 [Paramarteilia canceri]
MHSVEGNQRRWLRPNDCSAALRLSEAALAQSLPRIQPDQELYLRQRAALQAQILGNAMRLLILTNLCVRYPPSSLACVCINLAYKSMKSSLEESMGSNLENSGPIATISILENPDWVSYFDKDLSPQLLEQVTMEYLNLIQRTPNNLKKDLVKQTFSGSEPEYNQIVELLLVNAAKRSISITIDNQNDLQNSEIESGKRTKFKDKAEAYNSDENKTSNSSPVKTYLSVDEFNDFSKKFKHYINIQYELIRERKLLELKNSGSKIQDCKNQPQISL